MNGYIALREDIEAELTQMEQLVRLIGDKIRTLSPTPDIWDVAGLGKALSDFYTGVERIFQRIATKLDRDLPEGDGWHIQLLSRMSRKMGEIRPLVISKGLEKHLRKYLGFRHLFRNIYGMELDWREMEDLVRSAEGVFEQFKKEIRDFCHFLERIT